MSGEFGASPTLREQYWWTWSQPLTFVLLRQGEWILVSDQPTSNVFLQVKDRFVDLTRITSELVEVLTHNVTESVPRD